MLFGGMLKAFFTRIGFGLAVYMLIGGAIAIEHTGAPHGLGGWLNYGAAAIVWPLTVLGVHVGVNIHN
jgi:hypothetical protein